MKPGKSGLTLLENAKEYTSDGVKFWDRLPNRDKVRIKGKNPKKGITSINGIKASEVEKPAILTPWTPPQDEPEPGDYPQKNNSVYKMKRNVSPVNGKGISVAIIPGEINVTITNRITPSVMPRSEKAKPRKKKCP